MRRIVGGVVYETDGARLLASHSFGIPGDEEYYCERLFVTARKAFFLACEGASRSHFAQFLRSGVAEPGEEILPLSEIEALRWLELRDHAGLIEEHFGAPAEAGDGCTPFVIRAPSNLREAILQAAFERSTSVEGWIVSALDAATRRTQLSGNDRDEPGEQGNGQDSSVVKSGRG